MRPNSQDERQRVVAIAKTWIGTPYHHHARLRGIGVDCAMLLAEVWREFDPTLLIRVPRDYSPQWHLNKSDELYLGEMLSHTREVPAPTGPGDIVMWKFGRCFSHGGIIASWPLIIHARLNIGCEMFNVTEDMELRGRERRFFSYWSAP